MPEGHTVHRTAKIFQKTFAGQQLKVWSPQGRFAAESALLDNRVLVRAYAIGKQMFLKFDRDLTVRIHLGIYGKWRFEAKPDGVAPEPVGQVRVRFETQTNYADLRGPTACEILTDEQVKALRSKAGPDPLNPDQSGAECERFVQMVLRSKTAIGLLLMNQDVLSGIGNVYRAELLFRAGLDPHRPGNSISREQVEAIWRDSVKLLTVGVAKGIMITRDEFLTKRPTVDQRYFVYKREGQPCRVCGVNVAIELMATRKLYWCPGCQS